MLELGVRHAVDVRLERLEYLLSLLAAGGAATGANVLEVGSYEGESALFWSRCLARLFPKGGSVTCVDPWRPYYSQEQFEAGENYRHIDAALRSGDAYRRFLNNCTLQEPKAPILHVRGTLREALSDALLSRLFDVVYIDGDHCYEAVREDIALARPLVREGGVLCGDDLELQISGEEQAQAERPLARIDYVHGHHPGVSLAVFEAFGAGGGVWCQAGVWAVRRANGGWSKEVER